MDESHENVDSRHFTHEKEQNTTLTLVAPFHGSSNIDSECRNKSTSIPCLLGKALLTAPVLALVVHHLRASNAG